MSIELTSLLIGISFFLLAFLLLPPYQSELTVLQKRLDKIKNKSFSDEQEIKKRMALLIADTNYRIQFLGHILKNFRTVNKIKDALFIADSKIQVDTFIFLIILCSVLGILIVALISVKYALLGIIFGIIPLILLKATIDKRANLFAQQFPDALNMISSSLRAGHPLMASFETVVNEMPQPINKVFKTAVDDISLGVDIKDSLNSMIRIMPSSLDLKFFITAVLIQREVGGNLAELLDGLSTTIRERFKLLGQLKVQTAQTRFSGVILSLMPPVVGVAIFILSPEYMEPLLKTQQGNLALLLAVFLTLLGLYFINKITNIEI